MTTNLHRLSLPKIPISTLDNDTFSKDLLRQFDKKRSRLHFELGLVSQEPSPESSIVITPATSNDYQYEEPVQLDEQEEDEIMAAVDVDVAAASDSISRQRSTASKRSSSASDLFRKSSAYLRSKFDLIRKNKSHDEYFKDHTRTPVDPTSTEKPTKLFMKTTISIPSMTAIKPNTTITSKPPTITQYPPKPLVYSPIEPIPHMPHESKPLLHRISMPLMRACQHQENISLTRNKSIASLVNRRRKSEPDQHTKRKLKKQ